MPEDFIQELLKEDTTDSLKKRGIKKQVWTE